MMRKVIAMIVALALVWLAPGTRCPAGAATIGDDGLHKEDWFAITFRDIAEDIETANDEGKRLVIDLRAARLHLLQEDARGGPDRSGGARLHQGELHGRPVQHVRRRGGHRPRRRGADARRRRRANGATSSRRPSSSCPKSRPKGVTVTRAAVATMPGAFGKWTFLDMFHWVREKGYEKDEQFQKYHRAHDQGAARRRAVANPNGMKC